MSDIVIFLFNGSYTEGTVVAASGDTLAVFVAATGTTHRISRSAVIS